MQEEITQVQREWEAKVYTDLKRTCKKINRRGRNDWIKKVFFNQHMYLCQAYTNSLWVLMVKDAITGTWGEEETNQRLAGELWNHHAKMITRKEAEKTFGVEG